MLGVLGDEWTLLIAQQALLGVTRYGEFAARLPISHAVLTRRLTSMTADGLLERREYQTNPPRSDYALTQRGRALWPVLVSIWEWERRWVPDHAERLPTMHHVSCDADFAPVITCRECAQVVTEKELTAAWGPSGSWPRSIPVETTRRRSTSEAAPGRARAVSRDHEHSRQPLGLRAPGVGLRRDHPVQRLRRTARGSARLADRTGCRSSRRAGCWRRIGGRYLLTEKGRAVFGILITALQWAQRWFAAPRGPRGTAAAHAVRQRLRCRTHLRPML